MADFIYIQDGKLVVEDVKGYKTEVYKIKKKLMLWSTASGSRRFNFEKGV